jgi:transposase
VPSHCHHCDCRLSGGSRKLSTQGEPRRHQVTELPPIEAHITEYRCRRVVCPECGKATQAELPSEVQGHFGPDLTALIVYLTVVCRMPRRVVQELLGQVLKIPLSLGSIQNSWEETSEAVAEPCTELEKQLPHVPVINSDETVDHWHRRTPTLSWISRPLVVALGQDQRRKTLALGTGRSLLCVLYHCFDARGRSAGPVVG